MFGTQPAPGFGVTNFGLIKVRNNDAIDAERAATYYQVQPQSPLVTDLAAYINNCWSKAKEAKQPIEDQMMKNLRQRNGIYEADKLQAIRNQKGPEIYVLLTATKCRAAEAWINDVLSTVKEKPFTLDPTTMPDLTPELMATIREEVFVVMNEVLRQADELGQMINISDLKDEMRIYASERRDVALAEVKEEAKRRAARMELRIIDQMEEGGWSEAFSAVVSDFVTSKAAILKGPVVRRKKTKTWQQNGKDWSVATADNFVVEFERVSPLDLYPAPDSRGVDDGYLIERHHLTRRSMQAMIGVPGYSEKDIRAALGDYGQTGRKELLSVDSERSEIEFGRAEAMNLGEKIEALEFWGSVQGQMLIDWGMQGDIDPDLDYEITAWVVGNYVIRAILNPDKLGKKPYSVDSFERVPGSFWGRGVPELMADIQDICNAIARAVVYNASIAAGPQVEVDMRRVKSDNDEIYPWKIWKSDNDNLSEKQAIQFWQPQIITGPLMQVYEFFSAMSEDQTGIPRWAYGNADLGGAGSTSSGLSMLMTHASRNVKEAISHLDKMIAGVVERTYDYNMMYDQDPDIKGDCRVVARGSHSLLAKEQKIVRRNEFLAMTGSNPVDIELVGLKNRAKLLMTQAKELDMDIEDNDDLKSKVEALAQQIQQQVAMQQAALYSGPPKGAAPGEKPRTLDNAGNPAGGTDSNVFQNPQGMQSQNPAGMQQ